MNKLQTLRGRRDPAWSPETDKGGREFTPQFSFLASQWNCSFCNIPTMETAPGLSSYWRMTWSSEITDTQNQNAKGWKGP